METKVGHNCGNLRGMEVKITGVIHRLIFLKKKNIFFFFFFWGGGGGGIFVQIIGGGGGTAPPPYSYGPASASCFTSGCQ